MIIYVSIGNSDDKLTQQEWAHYAEDFVNTVIGSAERIHGMWYSLPDEPFQNACACFEITPDWRADNLRAALTEIRIQYRQDSIAWAVAPVTEFI